MFKKAVITIVCFILVANILPGALAFSAVEISSYGLVDREGKTLSFIDGEEYVKGYVDIINITGVSSDNLGELVVECYVNGNLEHTERITISIGKNIIKMRFVTDDIEVPKDIDDIMFKVYISKPEGETTSPTEIDRLGLEIPGAQQDGERYAQAINIVKALGIMSGYENGNFYASSAFTRAELAVVLTRLMGKESIARYETEPLFSDVDISHWAFGCINIVAKMNVMDGYEDGTFMPEKKVDAYQVASSLVNLLGYGPAVGALGYFDTAQELGIMEGTMLGSFDLVSRGALARLIFNSLDIPIMEQVGFGDYLEYVVQDGISSSSPYKKSILSESFGVARLNVYVMSNLGVDGINKVGLARVSIIRDYKTKYATDSYYEMLCVGMTTNVAAGNSDILSMVGREALVYVKVDETGDSQHTVLYAEKVPSLNEIADFPIDRIEGIVDRFDYYEVEFYENPDSVKTTKITVAEGANVYVNNNYEGQFGYEIYPYDLINGYYYGTISFAKIDSWSIADYDTIFINDYRIMIVEEVNTTLGRVTGTGQMYNIVFNPNNNEWSSRLVDINGNELEWTSLKAGDILAVQEVIGSVLKLITATLVENTVTGMVGMIDEGYTPEETEYGIGANTYKINYNVFFDDLELGDEGTFYLDIMGRIVDFRQSSAGRVYGYVMAIAPPYEGSLKVSAQIKLYTSQGEFITYNTAARITVIDEDGAAHSIDADEILDRVTTGQTVTFTLNSEGRINTITLPRTDYATTGFRLYAEGTNATYNRTTESFVIRDGYSSKRVYVDENTVIMQVGVAQYGYNYDDFALVSLAALSSASDDIELDEIEKIYAFDVDKSNFAGAIVIVGELDITNYKSGMAVVLSSETVLNDFDDVVSKVCVYQDYKNKNQALELLTHSSLGELSPILPGTVIFPKVNATGLITGYSEIALVQDGQVVPGEGFDYSYSGEYYLGHVAGKYGSRVTLDGLHDVVVPSSANVYVYDELMQSVTVEDMSCFDVIDGRIYRNGEVESASMLVREYDGEITDVVLYFFGGTGGTVPSETEINFCVAQELAAASVTYFNNADSTITPMLIVAHYENGKLIKLSQTQKEIPAESFEVLSCSLLSDFKRGDMVKAILVKSIDSLQPIKTSVYDLVDNDFSDESSITIDYDAIESTTFSTVSYCDDNSELKTINLASNCKVYRNGVATYDFNPSMFLDFYGTVTFADADGENRYSTVSITEYENTVVDYVNTLAKVVLAKEGMPVFYGETSSDKLALLFDTLGNRLDWSLLKENDVLSTKVVQGDNLTVYISTLVQETVEGQITEVDGNIVIINNCAYKVYDGIQLLPGNEGIFYLDILGRIVDFSLVEQANTTYAYVVALAPPYEGSLEGTAQIMFYTSQGEFATYDTATKFTVVGEDGSSVLIDAKDIIGKIEAGMVVTFTLNSQGRINRIILPKADLGATTGFRLYAEGTNATYNYRSESFVIRDGGSSKRVYVDSNTVIMKVGNVEYGYFDDDFELISLEGVSDDIELGGIEKIYAFDVNKSNIAKVIVIVGDFDIVSNPDIAMLVKTYVTSATNGERRAVATVFQNAIKNGLETVDLIASSDIGDYLGLQEGELFTARLNTAGEIKSGGITKVATINWGRAELLETGYGKASYSMHDVVSRSGAKIETEYGDVIVIPTKANIYVYNSVGSSPPRRVLAPEERHNVFYSFGYNLYDNNDNILDNVQMFVREYDGEITDVVFYLWY